MPRKKSVRRSILSLDRPESLARRAYAALRNAIKDRAIVAGVLYSEIQLAEELKISRTPVREALIELSREGIIEIVPQRGFRVRTISAEEEREVFDLRGSIESYVVRRLAKEARPEDLAKLGNILARQAKALDDPNTFLELDGEFHRMLPTFLRLQRTPQVLELLRGISCLAGSVELSLPHSSHEVLEEHRQIVEMIQEGNIDGAGAAMLHHIQRTVQRAQRRARADNGEYAISAASADGGVGARSGVVRREPAKLRPGKRQAAD